MGGLEIQLSGIRNQLLLCEPRFSEILGSNRELILEHIGECLNPIRSNITDLREEVKLLSSAVTHLRTSTSGNLSPTVTAPPKPNIEKEEMTLPKRKVTLADIHLLEHDSGVLTVRIHSKLKVKMDVKVLNDVLDRCRKNPKREVVGLLTGRIDSEFVDVKEAENGPIGTEIEVQFSLEELATMFEEILSKGRTVVGWYHSHPALGVFMSEKDVKTHRTLAQFGDVVALVVDPSTDEWKFFGLDSSK